MISYINDLYTANENFSFALPYEVSIDSDSDLLQKLRWVRNDLIYDITRRNLKQRWESAVSKSGAYTCNLLTSNLFYSRTTIVRKEKFEFEGILIIISILFLFLIGVRSGFFWLLASPFLANFFCQQK